MKFTLSKKVKKPFSLEYQTIRETFTVPNRFKGALQAMRKDPANCYDHKVCDCPHGCPLNHISMRSTHAYNKYGGECFNVWSIDSLTKITIHRG